MSEAMAQRQGQDEPALPEDFEIQMKQLQNQLAWIEEHGSKADCVQAIEGLEGLISSFRYHQAGLAHQLEKQVVREHEERGTSIDDQTRGAASTFALARKQSPQGVRNFLVNCRILFEDTPNFAAACSRGEFTEAQAQAILTPLQDVRAVRRVEFDEIYALTPDMFDSMGPKQIKETVQQFVLGYTSDPESKKQKNAEENRHVRFHVDEDAGCVKLSGELPLIAGLALKMYLREEARKLKKQGDPRTLAQIKADLLTSYMLAGEATKMRIALNVGVIMTDRALFLGEREPAFLEGYGFISAQTAREWIGGHQIPNQQTFEEMEAKLTPEFIEQIEVMTELTRLYTAPGNQELISMDSKARIFPEKLKKFIRIRDRHCRTPFCDGMVEEIDHVVQHARGGPTSVFNGDGRCSLCNKAKESAGWYEYVTLKGPHSMVICPGSSMSYHSTAPPAAGYAHKPFPQMMCDSNWISRVKEQLKNQRGPDPLAT